METICRRALGQPGKREPAGPGQGGCKAADSVNERLGSPSAVMTESGILRLDLKLAVASKAESLGFV